MLAEVHGTEVRLKPTTSVIKLPLEMFTSPTKALCHWCVLVLRKVQEYD